MSVDLENLSREDLIAEVRKLQHKNQELDARVDALSNQFDIFKRALTGTEDNFYELEAFGEGKNILDWLIDIDNAVRAHGETLRGFETNETQLTTDDRVTLIRQHLVDCARENDSQTYGADYKEIRALFNREISPSWSATLLKDAAGTFPQDPEKPEEGFEVVETKPRKKIRVHIDKVSDGSLL